MKIVYIVVKSISLGGGIEKYTEEVGSRLAERGHEIVVYTMDHYDTKSGSYRGMKVVPVPTIQKRSFEKMSSTLMATLYQCFDRDVDIVHYHAFGTGIFSIIPRLMGRKIVVQGHGLEWKRSKWSLVGRMFLKMIEVPSVYFSHKITVVSRVQHNYLQTTYGRESSIITTGTNPPSPRSPKEIVKKYNLQGNDYILFASRLVQEKGAHYLIEAYNQLKTEKKLIIAGDAKHEEQYKKRLYQLASKNPNIIFTGFVTGPILEELFSNAYVFVLPSEIEGLPTVLIEAMSYGNCCLASDIEENREVLADFGYTFINKEVQNLKAVLGQLLDSQSMVLQKKQLAAEYALVNFSWDAIADKIENFYKCLLA